MVANSAADNGMRSLPSHGAATAPYATANAIRSPSSWRITLGRLASHRRSATAPLITAAARLVITGRRQDVRKAGLRGSAAPAEDSLKSDSAPAGWDRIKSL